MKEVLLVIVLIAIFGFGYFMVKKLDYFIADNYIDIEKEYEKIEPSCVMLTDELTDEEIIDEIRRFKEKHGNVKLLVFDDIDVIKETW